MLAMTRTTQTGSVKATLRADAPAGPTIVARFEIPYRRFLDPDGKLVQPLPEFAREPQALVPLYRGMVLTRAFDDEGDRAAAHRPARHLCLLARPGGGRRRGGERDAGARTCCCRRYREQAAQFWRGVSLVEHLLYWGGDERGSDFRAARARFPDLRADRHARPMPPASPWRCSCRRTERACAVCDRRRRRHLEGRFLRGDQHRGRLAPARRVCHQQQPVGDLGAAQRADRRRDAGAEGDRRRHPRRAGRRQRRDRGARCRRASAGSAPAPAQGASLDRSPHLPARRPHHRR